MQVIPQTIPQGVDYIRILPELVLSAFGILVMVLDPLVDEEKSQRLLGFIALGGTVAGLLATWYMAQSPGLAFSNMVKVDGFSVFFHFLVIAIAAVAVVWFALRIGWLRSRLASRALAAAHATPSVFYAAAFLVSYEMATMFDDIRAVVRGLLHVARIGPYHETVRSALIAVAILGLVAGGACLAFQYRPSRGAREPRALPQ